MKQIASRYLSTPQLKSPLFREECLDYPSVFPGFQNVPKAAALLEECRPVLWTDPFSFAKQKLQYRKVCHID